MDAIMEIVDTVNWAEAHLVLLVTFGVTDVSVLS